MCSEPGKKQKTLRATTLLTTAINVTILVTLEEKKSDEREYSFHSGTAYCHLDGMSITTARDLKFQSDRR
ncbi:hypothetical protein KDA_48190 [Dictyobacter alpinus]|uniref:Uncharacterized protein n=1 Tax=Dictyobacter alpinus TaxID=2014873 RepID=A0A402BDA2_9CHLR|nr:hypothetical protein KDA_48190 [Dictyobacter alpinus]